MSDDELVKMVQEIDERGTGLTDWEREFIADQVDEDRKLFTNRQAEVIRRIHEERM